MPQAKNLLITGANGFVGQAFTRFALERGHNVSCLTRRPFTGAGSKNYLLSAYEPGELTRILAGVDVVVHLAAKAHQPKASSRDETADFYRVNVDNSVALARAAIAAGVKRFIYLSSIKVNGEETFAQPFCAADVPAPQDDYGRSKWAAEQALAAALAESQVELVVVRPPLVWGPEPKGNLKWLARLIQWHLPLPFAGINNRRSLVSLDNLCACLHQCVAGKHLDARLLLVADPQVRSTEDIICLLGQQLGVKPWLVPYPGRVLAALKKLGVMSNAITKLTGNLEVDSTTSAPFT